MIALANVSARGAAERGRARPVIANVSLEHRSGVLGIIGAPKDGTSLLLDVIDGAVSPTSGRVAVLGGRPDAARPRIAKVTFDAPLPEALRVDEVSALAADLRGEPRRTATERLGPLGIASLAQRRVRTLSHEERRAVALALALSSRADVILVDEPLVAIDPVSPRLVIDVLRARAESASVIVTTASPRDATRLADRLGVLTSAHAAGPTGSYAELSPELAHASLGPGGGASMRIVVSASHGKSGAARLAGILGAVDTVTRVETSVYASPSGAAALVVSGRDLDLLAKAVTEAIATARVDVELVEPSTLSLDAIRLALAARAMSPPRGSLPPGSLPPAGVPGSLPPGSLPPGSLPPAPAGSLPPPPSGSVPPSGGPR